MFSNLRHRVAVIGAIALMASVAPVLSSTPAGAVPTTALTAVSATDTASYSACPTGSAPASGFSDTTSTDVDCIAMHGITKGVTATTYEPDSSVPRWQMALYLTRAATSAGITLGSGADQGFTDISGESAEIQTAINQIKQLGVTTGTTATTFSPADNVTREQMAMFMERLLKVTPVGPGGSGTVNATTNPYGLNVNGATATYNYDDIDGGAVTFEGHNAIVEIYHLGLTGDAKTVRAFNPAGDITRGTMATWMTNALAHSNARPAGLVIQSAASSATGFTNNSPTLSVSHRDANRVPIAGTIVDIHEWQTSATAGSEKSLATGKCNTSVVTITGNSLTVCKVELGDMTTNAKGNVAQITDAVADGKTRNWYAWTAAAGTTFVEATHGSGDNYSTTSQSSKAAATLAVISTDISSKAKVNNTGDINDSEIKYGDTVNVTVQMSSAKNGSSYPAVAQSLVLVTFTDTVYQSASASVIESLTVTKCYTDAAGTCTYSMTEADQATTDGFTRRSLEVTTSSGAETSVMPATKPGHFVNSGASDTMTLTFEDAASAYHSTSIAQNATQYAAGSALAPVARNATASNWDQYGNAFTTATAVKFQGRYVSGAGEINCLASDICHLAGSAIAVQPASVAHADEKLTFGSAHGLVVGDWISFDSLSTKGLTDYAIDTPYCVKTAAATTTITIAATCAGGALGIGDNIDDVGAETIVQKVQAHNLTATDTVVFRSASADLINTDKIAVDTTYWVKSDGALDSARFQLALVSNTGTAVNWAAAVDDCTTGTCQMYEQHEVVGAATRTTTGGVGTASVAWSATASTSLEDTLTVWKDATHEATSTALRYITPAAATTLGGAGATAVDWTESATPGANMVMAWPREWDDTNNTIIVAIQHGVVRVNMQTNNAFGDTAGDSPATIVKYSYDDNDIFYLQEGAKASSLAGFEGAYVAGGGGLYGLKGHQADGTLGLLLSVGDIQHVDYEPIASNVSVFNLGT